MRVLRNLAFAGAASSAQDIIGAGSDVSGALTVLTAAGFVEDEGAIAPTPAGLAALDSWYARDRARFDTAACERLHVEFRPLDLRIKKIATEWQDAEARDNWDLRVAATQRLAGLHAETLSFFGRHQALLPRLEEYRTRLSAALERVMNGETDYFVKVAVDSYHTIWFQLHEDLLRLLQKERDAE